jgi:glycosyltransferase involved in cell wall biosynthesis
MIRIAHLMSLIGVGGVEQMMLAYCKYQDRARFECIVASPTTGMIAEEIRATGVPLYIGPTAHADAAREADLINLHWWQYDESMLALVQESGRPYVITLHWPITLPKLQVVTICTSEYARQVQDFPEQCVVIPNGIDLERFLPRRERPQAADGSLPEVVLTRVCRTPKCAFYFWVAMKQVLQRYPQTRLWIVGNDTPAHSTSDQVRFLGLRRDVPEILAETDIFVYTPNPRSGTRDLVVMEASAAGVPCVVSDVNGVATSVEEGVNGFLTPFGDVGAFVEKVSLLVEDGDLRAKMSRQAAQFARERFDIRDVVRRYEVVYQAALQGVAPGRAGSAPSRVSSIGPPHDERMAVDG